jgi:hypothetical protein
MVYVKLLLLLAAIKDEIELVFHEKSSSMIHEMELLFHRKTSSISSPIAAGSSSCLI